MRILSLTQATLLVTLMLGVVPAVAADDEPTSNLPASPIYDKPFLKGGGTAIGGYIDLEFKADKTSTFDQHRFVPFFYAEVSEWVHVASEIEFEHGGFVSGSDETDGEIKIEFATLDMTASDALNARAGIVLSPLGRLNVNHDAPMLDLTDRPLVTRVVIPTTLSESGLGVFGTAYPSEMVVVRYEGYLVNGFNASAVDPVTGKLHLRDARGSQKKDNNNSRSFVGRFAVSPQLGTEFGVSGHHGKYLDRGEGDHSLSIVAVDAIFATGPVELVGEAAWAFAGYTPMVSDPNLQPGDQTARNFGFYAEGRWHLFPGSIASLPLSVFTAVFRAEYVDEDGRHPGDDVMRGVFGFNFRITEETVIKNDLLLTRERILFGKDWGDTELGYRLSFASYF